MKRKIGILILSAVLLSSFSLFANGQQENNGKKDDGNKQVEITVWDFKYNEEVVGGAMKDMDSLFMASNPNIVINHIAQPHDNYYEILAAALSSGQGPDVILTHTDQRIWNMEEFLLPLDSKIAEWKDDMANTAWAACSSTKDSSKDIKLVPLTAQGVGIYYNKANLEKAGIDTSSAPSNWDDFLNVCEQLKNAGITPIVTGNSGQPFGVDFLYRVLLSNFYGDGLKGFSDGTANFTDEEFVEATRMIKTLYTKGYVNVENATMPYFMDAIETFKSGKGGFFIGLTSDVAHWKDFGDAFGYENLGYMPNINTPKAKYQDRQSNQGAGIGFAVVKASKHPDEALKYIYSMVHGESANLFLTRTGAIVPNKNIPIQNESLKTVVDYMGSNAVPDFYMQLDAAFGAEMYNYMQLFFLADEISLNDYIDSLQKAYELNL
ncbi:MAG: extracellular solute-binding protein [Spirochaetales bacterium]|nr:extracellular solute-binding protein [Spirochaetales bacterium]